jgi:pimeloyl-ACP methyl ester carboxylesterase
MNATVYALRILAYPYSAIFMSHPFTGSPKFPFNTARNSSQPKTNNGNIHKALAELPMPRKHYKWYYSTEAASPDMTEPKEQLHDFLKGYFYLKSAGWEKNAPKPLSSWTAPELAKLPNYYVMPLHSSMRQAVAGNMSGEDTEKVNSKMEKWLPDKDLDVYVSEFGRNTFQGGLNWYRMATNPANMKDLELFAGRTIDVPSIFIAGKQDWGTYQEPGAVEKLNDVCSNFKGVKLIDGAGHWVQQEQPEAVAELILDFIKQVKTERASY